MNTPFYQLLTPARWSTAWGEALFGTRLRRVLVYVTVGVLYLSVLSYHATYALLGLPVTPFASALYHLLVLACYGLTYAYFAHVYAGIRLGPLRVFWGIALMSALLYGMIFLIPSFGARGIYDIEFGFPTDIGTVTKMVVLSTLQALFAFFVLVRLQGLVLFKRTKRSIRLWYGMLIAMGLAAAFTTTPDPSDLAVDGATVPGILAGMAIGTAVGLMVANSFRLSWIVNLSFRDKMLTIVLAAAIFGALVHLIAVPEGGLGPADSYPFARVYSYPLNTFVLLTAVFTVLYCVTTFLSLLFHLPTTVDFEKKAGEVEALHSVSRLTGEVMSLERLVATIVAAPVEAGMGKSSWLALIDAKAGTLRPRVAATRNIMPAQVEAWVDTDALTDDAWQNRGSVLLNLAGTDHRIKAQPGDGIESLLVAPLVARNELLGALFVSKDISQGFEQDDVTAINTYADQVALALDNARLFEERLEKERLSREWAIAHEVQEKLLPQRLPQIDGVALAVSNVSANEVGGDYYDVRQIDAHRWAFIVGDVSGKGASAAFYMAAFKGVFQSLSRLAPEPAQFLSHANEALDATLENNVFISVVYGLLDLEKQSLTLARAGHCPIAMTGSDGEPRYLRPFGLGLGLDAGPVFRKTIREETIALKPGDTFVLYTDGVVESRSEAGEEYGYDRLIEALCRNRKQDAHTLHAALLSDLNG
ncbi:MAG: GAF domain-containing SpoIIE family protein phosphatase, partial [Bacteroidota bacterium]